MTPEQVELMKDAARLLLAHRDAGRACDPHSIEWAESILSTNPQPKVRPAAEPDPFEAKRP